MVFLIPLLSFKHALRTKLQHQIRKDYFKEKTILNECFFKDVNLPSLPSTLNQQTGFTSRTSNFDEQSTPLKKIIDSNTLKNVCDVKSVSQHSLTGEFDLDLFYDISITVI